MTFWCFRASPRPLLFLVLVIPEVHDSADRRDCAVGDDLDQVEPLLPGDGQRLLGRHDAELLAGVVDDANFAHADPLVDPRAVVTAWAGAIESDMDLLSNRFEANSSA